jgi:hypothetical protein
MATLPAAVNARPFAAPTRRIWVLAAVLLLALGLAACGHKQAHPTTADNEGEYFYAGPITYQVQLSRELNPFDVEDKEYINGANTTLPKPDEEFFAIFLWAKNQTDATHTTADTFSLTDTQGNRYYPIAINPRVNPYAWTPQSLEPQATQPAPDSTASFGPTQGGLLLFKINRSVYSNRPLSLQIYAPGQASPSAVSLDL